MKKSKTFGLLTAFTPEIMQSEYFSRIIAGVIDACRNTPYNLKFIMLKDEEYVNGSRQILEEEEIEGLILLTWRIHPKYVEEAKEGHADLPIVIINDFAPELKANIVYCDNTKGARLAVNHLLARGYRRIGMLQGPDEASLDARIRFTVFQEMLRSYEIPFDLRYFRKCEYFFEEDGYLKMLDLIEKEHPLPRAIVCFNDDIALGAMRALKENKISCPQQVAILGFDGIHKGKYVDPALTTIRQPLEEMGREMVRILIGIKENQLTPPVQKCFEPELVVRGST